MAVRCILVMGVMTIINHLLRHEDDYSTPPDILPLCILFASLRALATACIKVSGSST